MLPCSETDLSTYEIMATATRSTARKSANVVSLPDPMEFADQRTNTETAATIRSRETILTAIRSVTTALPSDEVCLEVTPSTLSRKRGPCAVLHRSPGRAGKESTRFPGP